MNSRMMLLLTVTMWFSLFVVNTVFFIAESYHLDKIENKITPVCNSAISTINSDTNKVEMVWYPKGCRHG